MPVLRAKCPSCGEDVFAEGYVEVTRFDPTPQGPLLPKITTPTGDAVLELEFACSVTGAPYRWDVANVNKPLTVRSVWIQDEQGMLVVRLWG